MTSSDNSETRPEIRSDDDWKERVKAENAAFDQSLKQKSEQKQKPESVQGPESEKESESQQQTDSQQQPPSQGETGESGAEQTTVADESAAQQLPPPDFSVLVGMFATQAMVALGLIPSPLSGKAEVQLNLARQFVDLLGVLETKTAGNLEPDEKLLLETQLYQLRMAFLEQSKKDG